MGILEIVRRLIYDFSRLPYHFDVPTLFALFFQRVQPIIGLWCIALGLLAVGYAAVNAEGEPYRALRRVALGGAFSLLAIFVYVFVPIWLDSLGISPDPGHVRFYGTFFIPVGALAGVLAVLVGSARWLAPSPEKRRPAPLSLAGYLVGFVVLWLVFLLYSWLVLGTTMRVEFGLVRATVTAALGALLFAAAPYLIHVVEPRPARRLLPWGYGLLVAGTIALLVAQMVSFVLGIPVSIF